MAEPRHFATYSPDNVASDPDGRLHSPSFERNAEPIAEALAPLIGAEGTVLEIGSGTGQHAHHLARRYPRHRWVPSDPQAVHRASIAAWRAEAGLPNLEPPLALDARAEWAARPELAALRPTAIFSANVIHIAPWAVAEGIVAGAGRLLGPGGRLIFYGPFRVGGGHTGEGNRRFDAALRAESADWGVREVEALAGLASRAGFGPPALVPMPSDNRIVAFVRG